MASVSYTVPCSPRAFVYPPGAWCCGLLREAVLMPSPGQALAPEAAGNRCSPCPLPPASPGRKESRKSLVRVQGGWRGGGHEGSASCSARPGGGGPGPCALDAGNAWQGVKRPIPEPAEARGEGREGHRLSLLLPALNPLSDDCLSLDTAGHRPSSRPHAGSTCPWGVTQLASCGPPA